MLYSNSLLHVVVKSTRITACAATLVDHIYTNTTADLNSGTGLIDTSDIILYYRCVCKSLKEQNLIKELCTHFSQELYRRDICTIDWNSIISENTKY